MKRCVFYTASDASTRKQFKWLPSSHQIDWVRRVEHMLAHSDFELNASNSRCDTSVNSIHFIFYFFIAENISNVLMFIFLTLALAFCSFGFSRTQCIGLSRRRKRRCAGGRFRVDTIRAQAARARSHARKTRRVVDAGACVCVCVCVIISEAGNHSHQSLRSVSQSSQAFSPHTQPLQKCGSIVSDSYFIIYQRNVEIAVSTPYF